MLSIISALDTTSEGYKSSESYESYESYESTGSYESYEAITSESKNPPEKLGENNHIEYTWSRTNIQELILQLSFQLVRDRRSQQLNLEVKDRKILVRSASLKNKFDDIMKELRILDNSNDTIFYTSIMVRLLCQTRDIVAGKGEYELSYMMLLSLYDYYPKIAEYVLERFVTSNDGSHSPPIAPMGVSKENLGFAPPKAALQNLQPYGSWKDIKYFAYYVKNHSEDGENHKLIDKCIHLINKQLYTDALVCLNDTNLSLCAKWVPREGSKKHSWLFKRLALDDSKDFYWMKKEGKTAETKIKRINKCYMNYRKMLSQLNTRIDTVQIKQCGNNWSKIDHNKTTSITLSRNKRAFLNVNKKGEVRSVLPDRIECAEKFKEYIENRISNGKEVKGTNVGFNNFTQQAFDLINKGCMNDDKYKTEVDLLNSQWRSNSAQNGSLNKMIAMVDTSGSMSGDPLDVAIAMGIRVAEKSILGKRVLTFSEKPTWHNLDKAEGFVEMVNELKNASWQMNTNFYLALVMILNSLNLNNVPPEDTEGMILVIFSDMQIDQADKTFRNESSTMIKLIKQQYDDAGYPCPHILFWNLRSTSGFPCLSNEKGASMMSGFSPTLLNLFCEKGMEALESATPWNIFLESINNPRYADIDTYVLDKVKIPW